MYNAFYHLKDTPFRLTPDPTFLYMTEKHREALAGLVYSVCNRAGLTVLVGEAGTGKTTLLHAFREWLVQRQFVVGLCTNPTLTREEFYDLLLVQLGVKCTSQLKSRQLMALEESLPRYHAEGRRAVLILDEAQRLSPELLEEVRLLMNLETTREKFLDIIIAGQPELTDMLARPELRQFKQRVSCYCKLSALTAAEVSEYVRHRLAQVGLAQQTIFPDDTLELIYKYTHGIPRLVSSLCDSALRTGFALEANRITITIVHEAAADLGLTIGGIDEPTSSVIYHTVEAVLTAASASGWAVDPPPIPVAAPAPAVVVVGVGDTPKMTLPIQNGGGTHAQAQRMPMETYATRQKSLGFLGSLISRWT
jgi:general secretion pathway protein A